MQKFDINQGFRTEGSSRPHLESWSPLIFSHLGVFQQSHRTKYDLAMMIRDPFLRTSILYSSRTYLKNAHNVMPIYTKHPGYRLLTNQNVRPCSTSWRFGSCKSQRNFLTIKPGTQLPDSLFVDLAQAIPLHASYPGSYPYLSIV